MKPKLIANGAEDGESAVDEFPLDVVDRHRRLLRLLDLHPLQGGRRQAE